jgi:Cu/Ag efflux protein CusF
MSSATGQELTGTVQKFDKDSKELTLANSDKKLKVSDDTQVTKDGQKGSLSDIKEGEQVRASYSGTGDSLQVTTIEVMAAGTTGKKHKSTTGTTGSSTGSSSGMSGSSSGTTGTAPSGSTGTDTGTSGSTAKPGTNP